MEYERTIQQREYRFMPKNADVRSVQRGKAAVQQCAW